MLAHFLETEYITLLKEQNWQQRWRL